MLIHPSHRREAWPALITVGVLLLILLLVRGMPPQAPILRIPFYLPAHLALEIFSIVVAGLIFGVVWSVRGEHPPLGLVVLGVAFLGVTMLDFGHVLSSHGMPAFITATSSDKAIYFWLATRALTVLALLLVAWLPRRASNAREFLFLLGAMLVVVAAVYLTYFLRWLPLPRFFIPGQGLTPTKILAEYILMGCALMAAARLWWDLRRERSYHASGLFAAACIVAENGLFFASYSSVTGLYILLGHVLKAIAYLFLYEAVFVDTVRQPYALLAASRTRLQATLDALPDLVLEMDRAGRYLAMHVSRPEELVGDPAELMGRTVREVMPSGPAQTVLTALAEANARGYSRGHVLALTTVDGRSQWFELSVARKAGASKDQPTFIVISRDISARRRAEQELLKLSAVVAQSPEAIIITDLAAHIEYVNDAFTTMTGYAMAEAMGRNADTLLAAGEVSAPERAAMWDQLDAGSTWHGEVINRDKSGHERTVSLRVYPLFDPEGAKAYYAAHLEDVSALKQASARIERLANFDHLTGLPNRNLLEEQFNALRASGQAVALLWLDIDHFKDVNDSLGHARGDELLVALVQRLHGRLAVTDVLSRVSGDKFLLMLPQAEQAHAIEVARSCLQAVASPLPLAGQPVSVTASIGIAVYPADAESFSVLVRSAEMAMYRAKEEGRNSYRFFAPEMQKRAVHVLALGNSLKQALANGELHLVYQPQLSLAEQRIVGAEALLRWTSPTWGAVSPSEFIPLAESLGLIVSIGDWVLRSALQELHRWAGAGLADLSMAVNLSALQFNQPGLALRIRLLVDQAGVSPQQLELELTEAVAMKNAPLVARRIEELAGYGIRFAIDDFGTGYSSLSYLRQFRAGKLKIDQSFVRDLEANADDQAIVAAVIQMAASLGMRTIAEGVETAGQQAFLARAGCDEIQGFRFARPMAAEQFEAFVRAHRDGQRARQQPLARGGG